jgi:membrane fusion protein, heavy metal efflux system
MKNMNVFLIGFLFFIGVIVTGVWWISNDPASPNIEKHHEEEDGERHIRLSDDEIKEFEIETEVVKPGTIEAIVTLSGEVTFNENQLAHIVPRVDGVVKDVTISIGDRVEKRQLLATIESRELADLKGDLLQANERLKLARSQFEREKGLFEKKITAEQEFLDAKKDFEEEKIKLLSAENKLRVIGFNGEEIEGFKSGKEHASTFYDMRSPISGTVVQKHLTLGEKIDSSTDAFTIANLGNVWVNLTVYQKDLDKIELNQPVTIFSKSKIPKGSGKVEYISSFLDESTRTATARVVLENESKIWKPGMFVLAKVSVGEQNIPTRIFRAAIQMMNGQEVVFIKEGNSFHPVAVTLGRKDDNFIEVLSGLEDSQEYVKKNGFVLKAELEKESFGGGHNH